MRAIALRLESPSSEPELIMRPSPVRAMPVRGGIEVGEGCRERAGVDRLAVLVELDHGIAPVIGAVVSTTTRTGRSKARAKSRSRWSWAGTAMTAPCP